MDKEKSVRSERGRWLDLTSLDGEGSIGSELQNLKAFMFLFGQWYWAGSPQDIHMLSKALWLWEHLTEDLFRGVERATAFNLRQIEQGEQKAA